MEIERFFDEVDPGCTVLFKKGIDRASDSKDPLHDISHLSRMLAMYAHFTSDFSCPEHSPKVVIASIIYHDSFKEFSEPSLHVLGRFMYEIVEGVRSSAIFTSDADAFGLTNKKFIDEVSYAIRKHSIFNVLPRVTTEAKILYDLDELDFWNADRLIDGLKDNLIKNYLDVNDLFKYFKHRSNEGFYFKWSNKIFEERKAEIIEKLNNFTN